MDFRDIASRMDVAILKHVATDVAVIDGVQVSGAFANTYVEIEKMQGTFPTFRCMVSDLGGSGTGSSIVYGGVTYKVAYQEPDGTGWTILILAKS